MKTATTLVLGLVLTVSSNVSAQSSQVAAAIEAGQVGERFDGYMGFAAPPSDELRRQVIGINIRRRSLYTALAEQRAVTAQLVGITAACALFRELPIGEAYMLDDKVWRRRAAGAPAPIPDHCRSVSRRG